MATVETFIRPNLIETPSASQVAALESGQLDLAGRREAVAELPDGTRGVRLDLSAIQIMDGLQGFLGLGKARGVYVMTTVIDGLGETPIEFKTSTYADLENGEMVPIGTGQGPGEVFNIYLSEGKIPRVLSFGLLVMRSNENLREVGTVVSGVVNDDRFKTISTAVSTAVAAANPAFSTIWTVAESVMGLAAAYLKAKADDQLAYYQANYTNLFDNLGLGKHPTDRPTMTVGKIRLAYKIDAA